MRKQNVESAFFFIFVSVVTVLFVWMVGSFLLSVFWAAVIAVLINPFYEFLAKLLRGHRNSAAFICIISVIAVILVPLGLLGYALVEEIISLFGRISSGDLEKIMPSELLKNYLPYLNTVLGDFGLNFARIQQSIQNAFLSASRFITGKVLQMGQNFFFIGILILSTLYILFFFLRDNEKIVSGIIRAIPMNPSRKEQLFNSFAKVSKATLKGIVAIAVIQGFLGGFFFWILGLEAPVFWGAVMTVLSIFPVVGAPLVWFPAGVILIFTGAVAKGIILLLVGFLVISLVDNFLRPILVSRDSQLPDYIVLISTLGGLTLFGISGFVIGPVIAGLFLVVWEMFAIEYNEKHTKNLITPAHNAPPSEHIEEEKGANEKENNKIVDTYGNKVEEQGGGGEESRES